MTEDDILHLEKQIQNLQVMHKVQKVERELAQMERELQQLMPVSAALARAVSPERPQGLAEDLPAWCSKISTLLKSMALLLATLGGKATRLADRVMPEALEPAGPAGDAGAQAVPPCKEGPTANIARSQSFSCTREEAEKEIVQSGVSVKNLKANYELQLQARQPDAAPERVYKRKRSLPLITAQLPLGRQPILEEDYLGGIEPFGVPGEGPFYGEAEALLPRQGGLPCAGGGEPSEEALFSADHLTRSLPVQTELSCVQDYIDMRKERIVYLFLEHWKKWTFTESERHRAPPRTVAAPCANAQEEEAEEDSKAYSGFPGPSAGNKPSEDDRLLYFMKQRQVVGKLIAHWRSIISQVPSRQIRRLSRTNMLSWPEHFLPHVGGSPVPYDSLTLDLFMLGYFQLLEMNLSRAERRFRHLLCYEMFDRLGSHSWELIRQFHKAVMEEVEAGQRDWADGFEDLKQQFFGDSPGPPDRDGGGDGDLPTEAPGSLPCLSHQESSQTLMGSDIQEPDVPGEDLAPIPEPQSQEGSIPLVSELGDFCNEDICRYIDRSFSFWKEKEAELFDI
ncbi:espin-like protein [Pogona vitticeps]